MYDGLPAVHQDETGRVKLCRLKLEKQWLSRFAVLRTMMQKHI